LAESTKLLPDWLRHPSIVSVPAVELLDVPCCVVEPVGVAELDGCGSVWACGVLLGVPEVEDLSCATANVAASRSVAEVKRMLFFMLPPN
jgi:hypothetical protein